MLGHEPDCQLNFASPARTTGGRFGCGHAVNGPRHADGFTLIDLVVSIAVIGVLIGILMPSLTKVRESARRVVCSSNIRQLSMGVLMYADDSKANLLPFTKFDSGVAMANEPQEMMILRTSEGQWDGLGLLYVGEYLDAPGIFYCPSHHGEHPMQRYIAVWPRFNTGTVVGNYQFRGGHRATLDGSRTQAVIADGMRSVSDYNHQIGANFWRGDMSLHWFSDPGSTLATVLPLEPNDPAAPAKVDQAWTRLDQSGGGGATP